MDDTVSLFAAFYIAAQATERIIEPLLSWLDPTDAEPTLLLKAQTKANKIALSVGLASLLGVLISGVIHLRLLGSISPAATLAATGTGFSPPVWLDTLITGLAIGGGTKPLHDLISTIEKAKETQ